MPPRGPVTAAVGAAVAAVLGGIGLFVSTRSAGVAGYVSEAGVTDAPHAALYRASVWAFAVALCLLGLCLLGLCLRPAAVSRVDRFAGWALLVAGPLAGVSGAVRCSAGCPLPPYERATAADLVHAGASIAALLLCGLAMVLLALGAPDAPLRRVGTAGMVLAVPLLGGAGMGLVFAGRGAATGVLERTALAATLAWLVALAAVLARRASLIAVSGGSVK